MYIIYVCDFGFETTDVGFLPDSVSLHLSHDIALVETTVLLRIKKVTEPTYTSTSVWYAQSRLVQLHCNTAVGVN
jgi:hypothetical protein